MKNKMSIETIAKIVTVILGIVLILDNNPSQTSKSIGLGLILIVLYMPLLQKIIKVEPNDDVEGHLIPYTSVLLAVITVIVIRWIIGL